MERSDFQHIGDAPARDYKDYRVGDRIKCEWVINTADASKINVTLPKFLKLSPPVEGIIVGVKKTGDKEEYVTDFENHCNYHDVDYTVAFHFKDGFEHFDVRRDFIIESFECNDSAIVTSANPTKPTRKPRAKKPKTNTKEEGV
jgi:hypothetical protein